MRTTVLADIRRGSVAKLEYLLQKADERRIPRRCLPEGWAKSNPGGPTTNTDHENGGINDIEIGEDWFVIFRRGGMLILDGYATRGDTFKAFAVVLAAPAAS